MCLKRSFQAFWDDAKNRIKYTLKMCLLQKSDTFIENICAKIQKAQKNEKAIKYVYMNNWKKKTISL